MVSFGFPRHFDLLLYYCLALFISLLFAFCGKNKLTYLLTKKKKLGPRPRWLYISAHIRRVLEE